MCQERGKSVHLATFSFLFLGYGVSDLAHFFDLSKPFETFNQKFKLQAKTYVVHWKEMEDSPDINATVIAALQTILDKIYDEGRPNDLVNVSIDHEALEHPIHIGYSRQEKLTALKIALQMKKVQQSKRSLNFESGLRLTFSRIKLPTGGLRSQK